MRDKLLNESDLIQKVKRVTQALLLSGALNIGLLAALLSFTFKEKQKNISFELKPLIIKDINQETPLTKEETLVSYARQSFADLLAHLEEKDLIEEGFCKRDLALSCLVSLHHFNLEKALGGSFFQERKIHFHEIPISLFPGITEAQFTAIAHYAKTERWPYTSRGLFKQLQTTSASDPSLLEAFFLTPECEAVMLVCSRTGLHVSKGRLAELICSGNWETLSTFAQQQRQALDLSPLRRDSLFLGYLQQGSPVAASLLLQADMPFALRRLDDSKVLLILNLLTERTPLLEEFAKKLLLSPRTDTVWKKAAEKLYSFLGESLPEPYDHRQVVIRFFPELLAKATRMQKAPESKAAAQEKKMRTHVVQMGDSLWKIAKKYQVSVEALMKCNQLETEKLRLGKELKIPDIRR